MINIQGICGQNMSKYSELKLMLTAEENRNLHIFGLSETKLKSYKPTNAFLIDGFQKPYQKDNDSNGGGGLLVYVRNGINTKRRRDLETKDISCLWIEFTITKTCLYNVDPLKPHFYIVKLGFTGVYIILLISAQKHRLWVLVRTASPRRF